MRTSGRAFGVLMGLAVGLGLAGCGDASLPPVGDAMVGDAMADGAVADGAMVDGAMLDGAMLDGAMLDGAMLDGAMVDGGPADTGSADSSLADGGGDASMDSSLGDGGGDASMDSGLVDGGGDASMDGGPADGSMDADAEPPPEFDAPTASIAFPPPVSLTEADTLIVRGSAADVSRIAELRVDGVLATTTDDFLTWTASVPLTVGIHALEVTAEDEWGNAGVALASIEVERSDPWIDGPAELAYAAPDRAFVLDATSRSVFEVNLTTGRRTVVGTGINRALGLSYDAASGHLYYATLNSVRSLDPTTGTVTVISDASVASPIALSRVTGAAFSATTGYVTDLNRDAVVAVDLTTGVRSEHSGSGVGTGTTIVNPERIELDAPRGRLIVVHRPASGQEVLAVEVATGNRTFLGDGVSFYRPFALDSMGRIVYQSDADIRRFDAGTVTDLWTGGRPTSIGFTMGMHAPADDRLLVADVMLGAVTEIDFTSGTATFLSRSELRGGEPIYQARRFTQLGQAVFFTDLSSAAGMRLEFDHIDLSTSVRTELSGVAVGSGPDWNSAGSVESEVDIAISPSGDTAWLTGISPGTLIEVDNATGVRTQLASISGAPEALAVDAATGVAYILNSANSVFAVTLATGDVTVLASDTVGAGHELLTCRDIAFDGTDVVLACRDGLTSIDVGTGERAQLAGAPGGGTGWYQLLSIDAATGDTFVATNTTLWQVDGTGTFTEVLDADSAYFAVGNFHDFHFDAAHDRLTLMSDRNTVFAVDVPTGEVVAVYR